MSIVSQQVYLWRVEMQSKVLASESKVTEMVSHN